MEKRCIVLHESVTEEMMDSSDREPWLKIVNIIQEDMDRGIPQQITFQTLDGQNFVHHVTEMDYGCPFLIVEGESISKTVERIYSLFPTYSQEDVFRMVRNPMNFQEFCKGIIYLGIVGMARSYDNEVFELFRQILQHEDRGIRLCGIFGMGYAAWPEFRALAQPLAENDPDEGIRQTATRFLEGLELYPSASAS
jgi:hypothetical protein